MTDTENGLLRAIKDKLDETHDDTVRVGEQVRQIDGRMERIEKNVDLVRSGWQEVGKEVALIQQECQRRGKQLSREHSRIDKLESKTTDLNHTGKLIVAKAKTSWWTLTVVGGVIATLFGIALGIAKYVIGD